MEELEGSVGHRNFDEEEFWYYMNRDYVYLSERVLAAPPDSQEEPWSLSTPGGFEYTPTASDLDLLSSEELIGYMGMSEASLSHVIVTLRLPLPQSSGTLEQCVSITLQKTIEALSERVDAETEILLAESVSVLEQLHKALKSR